MGIILSTAPLLLNTAALPFLVGGPLAVLALAGVLLLTAALATACLGILVMRIELDSDVINMLPKGFESVRGLKIYDRDFEQTRELTFALRCQPQDVDKLEEFAPQFVENLRKQPWCERVLAGSPMETPEGIRDLQDEAARLGDVVRLAGFESNIAAAYRAADIYCQPSHREGLPNSILEAMASGIAVVAARVDGTPEAVEDGVTGLLVRPRDPGGLASALVVEIGQIAQLFRHVRMIGAQGLFPDR